MTRDRDEERRTSVLVVQFLVLRTSNGVEALKEKIDRKHAGEEGINEDGRCTETKGMVTSSQHTAMPC